MEIPRFFIFNWVGHTADGLTEKTMYISMMVAGGGGEGSDQRKGGCMVLVLTREGIHATKLKMLFQLLFS